HRFSNSVLPCRERPWLCNLLLSLGCSFQGPILLPRLALRTNQSSLDNSEQGPRVFLVSAVAIEGASEPGRSIQKVHRMAIWPVRGRWALTGCRKALPVRQFAPSPPAPE